MYHKIIGGKKKKRQKNILKSVEYLLREKKPEEQKNVKILSGSKSDIVNFNNYSINKDKSNPYVCGVLSFEEETIPEELKAKIITEFEDLLFSGVDPENRPPILWVEHNDKNRVELNYLTFNQLQDKRAYTVYYDKSDRKLVNTYSEIINYENNLSSPFEEKPDGVGKNTLINKPKIDTPEEKKRYIEELNNHILGKIINQELDNREETIKYIESLEGVKINRIRKDRISIKCDIFKDDKPLVLRGDIYEENRDYSDYTREYTATINRDPELVKTKLRELKKDYSAAIERRTSKNRERYKKPQNKNIQQNREVIKRENTDIEYINATSNIDFVKSQSFLLPDDNDQNCDKGVKNELNNTTIKTETRTEETPTERTEREIDEVDQQQQYIDSRIEQVRTNQLRHRRTLNIAEERSRICRRSLHGFIQLFKRYIRPAQIFTRKKEIDEKFKLNKKRIEETYKKEQTQNYTRSNNRRGYKPF
ncbi:hypothetical protein [Escherichia coli]|uniref:hypothetical protein n=1 Tax=Escherichia coli TaxID=562 RepID=UPI00292A7B06|nr:hypothetical protein [Escherichia coli]MCJ5718245.1 hypothetical protein [Klebsiella pneumoniae]MDV2020762.1 hypothetical protein [Escherichia coli]WPA01072.1 hypothetical protein QDT99_28945 [Klebsiella pneumoniae]